MEKQGWEKHTTKALEEWEEFAEETIRLAEDVTSINAKTWILELIEIRAELERRKQDR